MAVLIKIWPYFISNKSDKVAVFELLKKQESPISLNELISKLGSNFSEQTVRRWLVEWVKTK